jgi:hypothetical protein
VLPPIADTEDLSSNKLHKCPDGSIVPAAAAAGSGAAPAAAAAAAAEGGGVSRYPAGVDNAGCTAAEEGLYMCENTMRSTTMGEGAWGYGESTTLGTQDLMASTTGSVLVLGEQTRATAQLAARMQCRQQQQQQ